MRHRLAAATVLLALATAAPAEGHAVLLRVHPAPGSGLARSPVHVALPALRRTVSVEVALLAAALALTGLLAGTAPS